MLAGLCGLWDRKAAGPKPCRPSRHVDPMTPAYLHQSAGTIHHVLASGKLWKGGRDSNSETFQRNPAGTNPAWQSWTSSRKRVLRGGWGDPSCEA